MEFLLDTANLEDIKRYQEGIAMTGVTTNPSILSKEKGIEFFEHMRTIREIIGKEKSLHIQVVSEDCAGMLKDAERILTEIDEEVYLKIPVSDEGLKAINRLKKEGRKITATAIYSEFQGYLAIASGADYLAPYVNRMENINVSPYQVIEHLSRAIEQDHSPSKIVAASFKNVGQVNASFRYGAHSVTIPADIARQALSMPSIATAVNDFTEDWEKLTEKGKKIYNL